MPSLPRLLLATILLAACAPPPATVDRPAAAPAPVEEPPRANATAIVDRAAVLMERQERAANDSAIALLSEAIRLDPAHARAHALLAGAYHQAMIRYGHPRTLADTALLLAERAIELDSTLAEGYQALGNVHFSRGHMRPALEAYVRAYEVAPGDPSAAASIGFMHLDLGDLAAAEEWTRRVLTLEPESAFLRAYAHRNLGRLHMMRGEYDEAEAALRRAIELHPSFPSARILLPYLHYLRGDTARAWSAGREMLALRPDDPETLNYVADLALMRGDLAGARRLYEEAIRLGPESRSMYRARRAKTGLAYALWKQGERDAARALFEERIAARVPEYEQGRNAWGPPLELAQIHATMGHTAEALAWLRRAVERGWREPHLARTDALLESLRDEAEFERILRSVPR